MMNIAKHAARAPQMKLHPVWLALTTVLAFPAPALHAEEHSHSLDLDNVPVTGNPLGVGSDEYRAGNLNRYRFRNESTFNRYRFKFQRRLFWFTNCCMLTSALVWESNESRLFARSTQ